MTHVVFNAAVFLTVFTAGWLVSLCLDHLNTIHRFPPQVYTLARRLEIWLFYLDSALSGVSFVASCIAFTLYLLEDNRWARRYGKKYGK